MTFRESLQTPEKELRKRIDQKDSKYKSSIVITLDGH